jgi:hypothetical protein
VACTFTQSNTNEVLFLGKSERQKTYTYDLHTVNEHRIIGHAVSAISRDELQRDFNYLFSGSPAYLMAAGCRFKRLLYVRYCTVTADTVSELADSINRVRFTFDILYSATTLTNPYLIREETERRSTSGNASSYASKNSLPPRVLC